MDLASSLWQIVFKTWSTGGSVVSMSSLMLESFVRLSLLIFEFIISFSRDMNFFTKSACSHAFLVGLRARVKADIIATNAELANVTVCARWVGMIPLALVKAIDPESMVKTVLNICHLSKCCRRLKLYRIDRLIPNINACHSCSISLSCALFWALDLNSDSKASSLIAVIPVAVLGVV